MKRFSFIFALLGACLSCSNDDDGFDSGAIDLLRSAIPNAARLSLEAPSQSQDGALTQAGTAAFALFGNDLVTVMNTQASALVTLLNQIVELPPNTYNADTNEAIWGPFDNDDGYGRFFVYIRENPTGDDFRYGYAFVRVDASVTSVSADSGTPVIWGGATPDPDDDEKGVGLTLWDFEADRSFETTFNPSPPSDYATGRFIQLYGQLDDDEASDDATLLFNYGVFKGFKDDVNDDTTIDLEAFYMRYQDPGSTSDDEVDVQSLDLIFEGDLCDADGCFDNDPSAPATDGETLRVHKAFASEGFGRAEVTISGGDLGSDVTVADECWDNDGNQLFVEYTVGDSVTFPPNADPSTCITPFSSTLSELSIPSLDDLDADDRTLIACIAEQGLEGCED